MAAVPALLRMNTMPSTTSLSSTTTPSFRWIALPIWPRRIFGPCVTTPMSLMRSAVPFCVFSTVFSMSADVGDQAHAADVDLLRALLR